MMANLLGSNWDRMIFILTCFFLWISQYFELYASVLTGNVLSSFTSEQDSNQQIIDSNSIPRMICNNFLDCNNSSTDIKKAILYSFVIVKVL